MSDKHRVEELARAIANNPWADHAMRQICERLLLEWKKQDATLPSVREK